MCLFIKKYVNLPAILNTGHVTGGHYWNDHTGTLSLGEVTATHLKIRAMSWYKDGLSRYGNFPYKYKIVFYLPNENPILVRRHVYIETASWAHLNIKTSFPGMGIPIFNMGIPILVRWHLYIEMAHWYLWMKSMIPCLLMTWTLIQYKDVILLV